MRPGKRRQTQIDGRRVEGIDSLGQVHRENFFATKCASNADRNLGEFGEHSPAAMLVGLGHNAARKSKKAHFDLAEIFPKGKPCKGQPEELVQRSETSDFVAIALQILAKSVQWQEIHKPGENGSSLVH